jgi:CheY-like chemotaxis protein/archaellum biogenesis ATPase FlaH
MPPWQTARTRGSARGTFLQATGADIIDHVLGGYPPGLPLVLAGPSGAGRTVLGLQLANAALAQGQIVQIVSSEPAPSLIHQAGALGFDFEAALQDDRLVLLELDSSTPALVRAQGADALAAALRAEAPEASLVIVDPFTAITAEISDEPRLREVSRVFVRAMESERLVLTVEADRLGQQRGLERVLSELCGAYLVLEREASGRRTLSVEKSRSGLGAAERVEFSIGPGGTHMVGEACPKAAIAMFTRVRRVSDRHAAELRAVAEAELAAPVGAIEAPPRRVQRAHPAAPPMVEESGDAGIPERERRLVLLVEDSRMQRELVKEWLEPRYDVITAADGFEALAKIVSHQPDLVILDLIMPRVTGYELLAALRRAHVDVPVLVSSSRVGSTGDRLGPLVLGATDFLPKPVNRIELEHKVETLLRLRRMGDRRFDSAEAEELFGRVSSSRLLELADFRERVARACSFGDRHGLVSAIVRVRTADEPALDAWIEVANDDLRFEDAVLRRGKREALVLLVATGPADAPKVIERTNARCAEATGTPPEVEIEPVPAADWLAIEGLEQAAPEAPPTPKAPRGRSRDRT